MTVTIVCRNNPPPADEAARPDEGSRANESSRSEGSDKAKATPTPAPATAASDGVCRLGQNTSLNLIGALHPGSERGNGLVAPSANTRTGVTLRPGEPEPPPASATGELRPETARAVRDAQAVPGTADVMVASDQRSAIQGWGELIRTTPGLEDAARARGMTPENLAQILGSTAWNQRIEGAAGESAVGIPTDPKQVWDLAQRAMDTQNPSIERQATTAGQVVSDNAIARMTADGMPLPDAVRSFGTNIRDTANDLHAFYAGTEQADRFPAFTAANGGELTQSMLNASFRSSPGYDESMGDFSYDPNSDYASNSSDDFTEQQAFYEPSLTPTMGYSEDQRPSQTAALKEESLPMGAVGTNVHEETLALHERDQVAYRARRHQQIAEAGRALRNGERFIPRTRVV